MDPERGARATSECPDALSIFLEDPRHLVIDVPARFQIVAERLLDDDACIAAIVFLLGDVVAGWSEQVRRKLKELIRGSPSPIRSRLAESLKIIDWRLHHDPRVYGEPLYTLSGLRLEVRQAVSEPLSVIWVVHWNKPVVFITACELLSGQGS